MVEANNEKERILKAGEIVEAFTSKGMERVLVTYLNSDRYEGIQLTRQDGVLGSEVKGVPEDLFEEKEGEFGVIIESADDPNLGIYIYRNHEIYSVFHRDDGELIDKVRSTGAALKIASHKLKEYADYSIDNGYDWSKTQAQAEKLLSDKKNLMYLNMVLGNK